MTESFPSQPALTLTFVHPGCPAGLPSWGWVWGGTGALGRDLHRERHREPHGEPNPPSPPGPAVWSRLQQSLPSLADKEIEAGSRVGA